MIRQSSFSGLSFTGIKFVPSFYQIIQQKLPTHKFIINDTNFNTLLWVGFVALRLLFLDCDILVSEVELQSRYYIHFQANTFGEGMKSLILRAVN